MKNKKKELQRCKQGIVMSHMPEECETWVNNDCKDCSENPINLGDQTYKNPIRTAKKQACKNSIVRKVIGSSVVEIKKGIIEVWKNTMGELGECYGIHGKGGLSNNYLISAKFEKYHTYLNFLDKKYFFKIVKEYPEIEHELFITDEEDGIGFKELNPSCIFMFKNSVCYVKTSLREFMMAPIEVIHKINKYFEPPIITDLKKKINCRKILPPMIYEMDTQEIMEFKTNKFTISNVGHIQGGLTSFNYAITFGNRSGKTIEYDPYIFEMLFSKLPHLSKEFIEMNFNGNWNLNINKLLFCNYEPNPFLILKGRIKSYIIFREALVECRKCHKTSYMIDVFKKIPICKKCQKKLNPKIDQNNEKETIEDFTELYEKIGAYMPLFTKPLPMIRSYHKCKKIIDNADQIIKKTIKEAEEQLSQIKTETSLELNKERWTNEMGVFMILYDDLKDINIPYDAMRMAYRHFLHYYLNQDNWILDGPIKEAELKAWMTFKLYTTELEKKFKFRYNQEIDEFGDMWQKAFEQKSKRNYKVETQKQKIKKYVNQLKALVLPKTYLSKKDLRNFSKIFKIYLEEFDESLILDEIDFVYQLHNCETESEAINLCRKAIRNHATKLNHPIDQTMEDQFITDHVNDWRKL